MAREYYSIPEAAALLGVSRIAVFKKVKSGRIAALRFGRNWAISAAEVQRALAPAAPPPPRRAILAPPLVKNIETRDSDEEMSSMGWD